MLSKLSGVAALFLISPANVTLAATRDPISERHDGNWSVEAITERAVATAGTCAAS